MDGIDEKTKIPISLAVVAIGGAAAWLTTIYIQGISNAKALERVLADQDKYTQNLEIIRDDIAQIKGELKRIKRP